MGCDVGDDFPHVLHERIQRRLGESLDVTMRRDDTAANYTARSLPSIDSHILEGMTPR